MNKKPNTILLDGINRNKVEVFFTKYYQKCIYGTDVGRKEYLGNKTIKVCRFCGRSKPAASFKNEAHVIPQLLGNRNLL